MTGFSGRTNQGNGPQPLDEQVTESETMADKSARDQCSRTTVAPTKEEESETLPVKSARQIMHVHSCAVSRIPCIRK